MKKIIFSFIVLISSISISLTSCGGTSSKSKEKCKDAYIQGYNCGKDGKGWGVSDPYTYCEGMSDVSASIPSNPSQYFVDGYNDAYYDRECPCIME